MQEISMDALLLSENEIAESGEPDGVEYTQIKWTSPDEQRLAELLDWIGGVIHG